MDKAKKPFYKKWWVWLIVIVVVAFVYIMSQPATEEYKKDAQVYSYLDYADGKVSGSTKVELKGKVSNVDNETMIVTDSDGLYYVKNEDVNKTKLEEDSNVTIYGVYVGDDSETGYPKIVAKLIEK